MTEATSSTSSPYRRPAPEAAGLRARIGRFIESAGWERFIMGLILVNAVLLGLETSATVMAAWGPQLEALDAIILGVFVAEIVVRLWTRGPAFFRDPWSVFDFIVVGIALLPDTGGLAVLRSLRILRVFRLISAVGSMRRVVAGLLTAIPGMGSVVALLLLVLYVFSVMATKLYAEAAPEFFGTLGMSAFSLFKVMTLEGWPDIADKVMETHPNAWAFFLIYILLTSFAVLNLFIGIIVDSMSQEAQEEGRAATADVQADFDQVMAELRALREEVRALKR